MQVLSHQFMLAKNPAYLPAGYQVSVFAEYYLASADDLPVIPLLSPQGESLGFLLGWPVTLQGEMLTPSQPQQLSPDTTAAFETWLYRLGGRWLCLSLLEGGQFYTDAMASQPCIYCPQAQLIMSSAALLPSPWQEQVDTSLMAAMDVRHSEHFYLFALLPQKHCLRLLANHKLLLSDFSVKRHWPQAFTAGSAEPDDLQQKAKTICAVVQAHISACAGNAPTKIGLSAGYETRLMLACAKPWLSELRFWTRKEHKTRAGLDQKVASHLAGTLGLQHQFVLPPAAADSGQSEDEWLARTGHCIGGSALRYRALIDIEQGRHFALTGIGGELCRAFYWPEQGLTGPLTAALLHRLSGVPEHPAFAKAARDYLQQLPDLPLWQQLGLFYLENRVGAYASVHKYGNKNGIIFMYPLNHRHAVDAMLTLPLSEQQKNKLHRAVICHAWPELDQLPYNEPLGFFSRSLHRLQQQLKKQLRALRSALYRAEQ